MKKENCKLEVYSSNKTVSYIDSNNSTSIIHDEAESFVSGGNTTTLQQNNQFWENFSYFQPVAPEGIGALGEIYTDDNGFKFVYTKEGWIQVVNVIGPGLWEQLHGKEEETKCEKKKLKCF